MTQVTIRLLLSLYDELTVMGKILFKFITTNTTPEFESCYRCNMVCVKLSFWKCFAQHLLIVLLLQFQHLHSEFVFILPHLQLLLVESGLLISQLPNLVCSCNVGLGSRFRAWRRTTAAGPLLWCSKTADCCWFASIRSSSTSSSGSSSSSTSNSSSRLQLLHSNTKPM